MDEIFFKPLKIMIISINGIKSEKYDMPILLLNIA